jgi:aspartyl-tRNA(Asn)/glutamyl-tRNA(Gln) amidotransferase subunit A
VAGNAQIDHEVSEAFTTAVETICRLGFSATSVDAPLRVPTDDLSKIESDRREIASELFKDVDVLLLPTTTTTVPTVVKSRGAPRALSAENTIFANYYGLPSVSVPCGSDRNGLPLGLQVVGRPWDEVTVLHLAHKYEEELGRSG